MPRIGKNWAQFLPYYGENWAQFSIFWKTDISFEPYFGNTALYNCGQNLGKSIFPKLGKKLTSGFGQILAIWLQFWTIFWKYRLRNLWSRLEPILVFPLFTLCKKGEIQMLMLYYVGNVWCLKSPKNDYIICGCSPVIIKKNSFFAL